MNFLNFEDQDPDQHVYRIMEEAHVLALFAEGENWLRRPHFWKDKFENFQLKLGGALDGAPFAYGFAEDFVGQCWTRDAYSEAMWGIYASDPNRRFLRIRSTPRRLLAGLIAAHPQGAQDRCFFGKVAYRGQAKLKAWLNAQPLEASAARYAGSLLMKRWAFRHEREMRLLYLGDAGQQDAIGFYRYAVDPHALITQIMADPNRDRAHWTADRAAIARATGFAGPIKRSMIYDPPQWDPPAYQR